MTLQNLLNSSDLDLAQRRLVCEMIICNKKCQVAELRFGAWSSNGSRTMEARDEDALLVRADLGGHLSNGRLRRIANGREESAITIYAATTFAELIHDLGQKFMKEHPDVRVKVMGRTSEFGFQAMINKEADLVMAAVSPMQWRDA